MPTKIKFNLSPAVARINPVIVYLDIEAFNSHPVTGLSKLKQVYSDGKTVFVYYPETQELMTFTEYTDRISEWHDALLIEELRRRNSYSN